MAFRFMMTVAGVLALMGATASASSVVVDQSPYNPLADFRNSNTLTNGNPVTGTGSNQQAADDFTIEIPGLRVTQINLWFAYQFGTPPPIVQGMVLRIWNDLGGVANSILFQESVSFTPIATGDVNSLGRAIFRGEVMLENGFLPNAGERYWLNPLGSDDSVTWGWQFQDATGGERLSRMGNAITPEVWRVLPGNFAFQIVVVPEPSGLALLALFGLLLGLRRTRKG